MVLAGGRGTRFWPLSRRRCAKQLLPLDGKKTMIQQTIERLLPVAPAKRAWIITNDDSRAAIARQLPKLEKRQIIAEPIGRNTAPAVGLAAFLLLRSDPSAVIGLFPSDHVIADDSELPREHRARHRDRGQRREHRSSRDQADPPGNRLRLHRSGGGLRRRRAARPPLH